MKKLCIMPNEADKLRKALKSGELKLSDLIKLSSQGRVDTLAKYIGEDMAKVLSAQIEKAILSPRQKQAIMNVAFKMTGQQPLYRGVSLEQAQNLSKLSMSDLKKMTDTDRLKTLSKHLDEKVAERLSQNFVNLKKTGNLHLWEQKAMGTKTLREARDLKGSLARLEALDDMGVLTPENQASFMENLVEQEMGIGLTVEEAQKISKMTREANKYWDKIGDDWTYKNSKNVEGYFEKLTDLESYQQSLMPSEASDKINTAFDYARANILGSPRIIRNSFLYQIIPTVERFITKRLVPSSYTNLIDAIKSKSFSSLPNSQELKFIQGQLKMTTRIYSKTGIDISRLETLGDGYRVFGGEKFFAQHGKYASKNALQRAVNWIRKSPKWTAGGTDMLAAAVQRADTAIVMSKEIAYLEASKMKFKTPEIRTKWINERSYELLKESYSFNPKGKAEMIRAQGIFDAQLSNNTQKGGATEIIVKLRDNLKLGKVQFGKLIVPFARIATKSIERGLGIAFTPGGAGRSLWRINRASKIADPVKRATFINKELSLMVGNIGLLATTILIASFLDDDDYIGPYSTISQSESELAKVRGAQAGSIRIGGKWIPIRYLPLINIPLASIMTARQQKARGAKGMDVVGAYLSGMLGGVLDTPVLKEISGIYSSLKKGSSSNETIKLLNSFGLDGESLFNWAKVRALPSAISWDLYNMLFPPEAKYDFLGNRTQKTKWYGFREDLTNDISLEFNRLFHTGNMPTISDPKKPELVEKLGKDAYIELLNRLKQNYADEVYRFMNSKGYEKLSDEEKKKEIDKLRKSEILDKLK